MFSLLSSIAAILSKDVMCSHDSDQRKGKDAMQRSQAADFLPSWVYTSPSHSCILGDIAVPVGLLA